MEALAPGRMGMQTPAQATYESKRLLSTSRRPGPGSCVVRVSPRHRVLYKARNARACVQRGTNAGT